jgi:hypothetical protein
MFNERCAGCNRMFPFEEQWDMELPPEYCECGGARRPMVSGNEAGVKPNGREYQSVFPARNCPSDFGLPIGMYHRSGRVSHGTS